MASANAERVRRLYRRAIDRFGGVNQCLKALEEMGELSQALAKYLSALDGAEKALQDAQEEKPGMYMLYKAGKTRDRGSPGQAGTAKVLGKCGISHVARVY